MNNKIEMKQKNFRSRIFFARIGSLALMLLMMTGVYAQPSGGPYGPVKQNYQLPEVDGRIYYVAPDGRDDASGSSIDAPTSIENAIAKVEGGDAIVLRGGTYRTGDLQLNQGVVIQPYADEQPVLKGTLIADEWTPLRNKLWITKWEKLFPSAPQSWWVRTRQGMFTPLYKFNDDMVFVDGRFLSAVGWEGDVDENSFYIDYEAGLVYIGVNPEGKQVEITAWNVGLERVIGDVHGKASDGKGYTMRGITFTQYAYRALEIQGKDPEGVSPESEHGKDVVGTTIENCEISYCSRVAGYLRGDHLTLRNNRISDTSTEGIFILASNDVLLEKNIFTRNNIEEITGYFPAAVKIFNQCYRVTCNDNLVIDHPFSNGIWYDVGNIDGVFTNNWIEGVGFWQGEAPTDQLWPSQNGFFFEISKGALCAGNVFVNCDHGMMVLNSSDVKAYNNTFVNSMACIGRNERSAEGDHFGWHPATGPGVDERVGHEFVNNLLVADAAYQRQLLFVWQPPAVCESAGANPLQVMDHNLYIRNTEESKVPLILWSPADNEKCQNAYASVAAFRNDHPEYEQNSYDVSNYGGSPFMSSELGNYRLQAGVEAAYNSAKLPSEIMQMINRKKEVGIGAYPIKK
ncbi:right-handed parallel beta-helix repeat-containing protein [Roseimarinus sediminis]|uniref:right-handed parallel beta-helix repeat-containing protein n=1 Tax=Roseimarinus sediminis TaxID=1610899 RepID=UPI003D1BCDBA